MKPVYVNTLLRSVQITVITVEIFQGFAKIDFVCDKI